jgi:hypothetical protein
VPKQDNPRLNQGKFFLEIKSPPRASEAENPKAMQGFLPTSFFPPATANDGNWMVNNLSPNEKQTVGMSFGLQISPIDDASST